MVKEFITRLKVIDSIFIPIRIFYDNISAIHFFRSTENTIGVKYIELEYYKLREMVDNGDVTFSILFKSLY